MAKILQRFGDGYLYEMTEAGLKKDIVEEYVAQCLNCQQSP